MQCFFSGSVSFAIEKCFCTAYQCPYQNENEAILAPSLTNCPTKDTGNCGILLVIKVEEHETSGESLNCWMQFAIVLNEDKMSVVELRYIANHPGPKAATYWT